MPSCIFFPALYASYLFCVQLSASLSLSPSLSAYVYLGLCRCYVVIYSRQLCLYFLVPFFVPLALALFFLFVFAFSTNLTFVLLWSTSRPAASSLSTPLLLSLHSPYQCYVLEFFSLPFAFHQSARRILRFLPHCSVCVRAYTCMCVYVGGWATHFLTLVCSGKRVGNAAGAMRFPCSGWLSTEASWGLGFYLSARATRVCVCACMCV